MDTLELTDYADRYVVDRLSSLDGVSRVRLGGGQRYAMRIWLDSAALAARGLTVADVESALERENVELPAGSIESTDRDFTLRVQRGYREPADFAQADARQGRGRLSRAARRRRPRRARLRGAPRVLSQQRRRERRDRHRQDLDGEQPRRRARRPRDGRGGPEEPSRGHADLRRLRLDRVHRRGGRARVRDAVRGDRARDRRDLPVPRQCALGADPGRHDPGLPRDGVRGAVGLRVHDQPADPARDRAVHRARRGRRHRGRREHPAPGRPRRAAARRGAPRHGAGRIRGDRDDDRAGRCLPAGRVHGGQHGTPVPRARGRARERGRDLLLRRAVADADDVLDADPAAQGAARAQRLDSRAAHAALGRLPPPACLDDRPAGDLRRDPRRQRAGEPRPLPFRAQGARAIGGSGRVLHHGRGAGGRGLRLHRRADEEGRGLAHAADRATTSRSSASTRACRASSARART